MCRAGQLQGCGTLQTRLPTVVQGVSQVLGVLQVSAHTSAVDTRAREEFAQVVDAMAQKLRAAKYNGCYFDRGAAAGSRLCTPEGWFSCQVGCVPWTLGPQRLLSLLPGLGGVGWGGVAGQLLVPGVCAGPRTCVSGTFPGAPPLLRDLTAEGVGRTQVPEQRLCLGIGAGDIPSGGLPREGMLQSLRKARVVFPR